MTWQVVDGPYVKEIQQFSKENYGQTIIQYQLDNDIGQIVEVIFPDFSPNFPYKCRRCLGRERGRTPWHWRQRAHHKNGNFSSNKQGNLHWRQRTRGDYVGIVREISLKSHSWCSDNSTELLRRLSPVTTTPWYNGKISYHDILNFFTKNTNK